MKKLPYPSLHQTPKTLLDDKVHSLKELYNTVNKNIDSGKNEDVILKTDKLGDPTWRLRPLEQLSEPNNSLFDTFPKRGIVDVIHFVEDKLHLSKVFTSILPRSSKLSGDWGLISPAILANALRMGKRGIAGVSDLNLSELLSTENAYIRLETLAAATDFLHIETSKPPIFKHYDLAGNVHVSLDGLKLSSRLNTVIARHSKKYFGNDPGVSGYNLIYNHLPITGRIIGCNEYEGNFTFEMLLYQNAQAFDVDIASTDKHGTNAFNFALFDFIDLLFAPRIPKPHNETLWGFGQHQQYNDFHIRPDKIANPNTILNGWDEMLRMLVSMLTGEASPSTVIGKMSSKHYRSKTKLAFSHYNNIIRTEFILRYINEPEFRRAIECALNRGESFNNLYRAITLLNGGKFRGQSEVEIVIWDACTRLIASVILYYNTYILNELYVNAKSEEEKTFILRFSPGAWTHINMLGYYQFLGLENSRFIDDRLKKWEWQRNFKFG